MSESLKNKRIIFREKGVQRNYILNAKIFLNLTGLKLAQKLKISQRTLTAWTSEEFHMPYLCAKKLSDLANIQIPINHTIVDLNEHMRKIGKIGAKNRMILYEGKVCLNEYYRRKKWIEWWDKVGKYKKKSTGFQDLLKVSVPKKDKKLAEFVGIMLGDGGIAKYHIHITLSNKEKEYIKFIVNLITKLFKTTPKIHKLKQSHAIDIVVQRKQLVDFCLSIGLVQGNKIKQNVDIPSWVKENNEFSKACIRGLIDTDGCFYSNSYISNNKKYSYFKIAFVSGSELLLKSVEKILNNFGFKTTLIKRRDQKGGDVRITSNECVKRYIKMIGSQNEKHLKKIRKWQIIN